MGTGRSQRHLQELYGIDSAGEGVGGGGGGGIGCAVTIVNAFPEGIPFDQATVSGQTVSAEIVGVGDGQGWFAFQDGLLDDTGTPFDLSTGKKVIEYAVVVPAAESQGSPPTLYSYELGLYLVTAVSGANSINTYVGAQADGLFRVNVQTNISGTGVEAPNLASLPSVIGIELDCDAGTYQVYFDGVAQSMNDDTFAPGSYYLVAMISEYNSVHANDIGKTVSATLRTSAADFTGTYTAGATDLCGNVIGAP